MIGWCLKFDPVYTLRLELDLDMNLDWVWKVGRPSAGGPDLTSEPNCL